MAIARLLQRRALRLHGRWEGSRLPRAVARAVLDGTVQRTARHRVGPYH